MQPSNLSELRQILADLEGEKKLAGLELHDGLLQLLVGSKLQLEAIDLDDPGLSDRNRNLIDSVCSGLQDAIQSFRSWIGEMNAATIDDGTLVPRIEHVIEKHRSGRLNVDSEFGGCLTRLDPLLAGSVFRIVQESMQNIARHSGASQALVSLQDDSTRLRIRILDNGKGLTRTQESEHFGLRSIQHRARIFGGTAKFHSSQGEMRRFQTEVSELLASGKFPGIPGFATGTAICVELPRIEEEGQQAQETEDIQSTPVVK